MAEGLSPNHKQKLASVASQLQSPTSPFILGSNDDKLEKDRARAARAAAIRRKPVIANNAPPSSRDREAVFGKQQILELFQNCIKLASENKINQKNTWELNLIDHLSDIIKVEEENDVETNFQKASCSLEAGVKIYSLRVDSVHSEAYKVLGGMNRAAGDNNEQDSTLDEANAGGINDEGKQKKEPERKISPLLTLEPSFETLNAKKFDVAFAVDPLYHQTSAQFDAGGAKGLLLNNLGVYGRCQVIFDSQEVPGKLMPSANPVDKSEIDLSFAKEYVEQMVLNMPAKDEISPSLKYIINLFDDGNKRPLNTFSGGQKATCDDDIAYSEVTVEDASQNIASYESVDQPNFVDDEGFNDAEPHYASYHEEAEESSFHNPDMDDRSEKVDEYLFLSLGITSKRNAWAGPDHWKYRKSKVSEDPPAAESGSPVPVKKRRVRRPEESENYFTEALEEEQPDVLAPPKNPKLLLLPANRAPGNTKLPEDCHYQPENLVKLFLLPNTMCFGRRKRSFTDEFRQENDDNGAFSSWNDEAGSEGPFDDGSSQSDVEDPNTLVSQPRQVNKIDVQYDKTSKQVDVQVLKQTLWGHILNSPQEVSEAKTVYFHQLLATFPTDCKATLTVGDLSPHLCFICLLHLANEHGLSIRGYDTMDDLSISMQDEFRQENDDNGAFSSWNNEAGSEGPFDDGSNQSDVEDPNTLVSQPRQVNKIDVQYDKTSKQVDVQVLKQTLWDHILDSPQEVCEAKTVYFHQLLATFPTDCKATLTVGDLSPHLCFICLLHLANEHGLSIRGYDTMDDLSISMQGVEA